MEKSAEKLRGLGLEPLTEWGADRGRYERWLMSEGVRVVMLYDHSTATGQYGGRHGEPWVPPWVNMVGREKRLRGERLETAVRVCAKADLLAGAVAAAFALGGARAVEQLLFGAAAGEP